MRNARGCTHFESIVGNVNISQCDSLMKLLSVAPSSSTVIFKRLKSKQKYLGIMERLTLLLRSLTVPDLQLTPDRVLLLLREAAALVQRVGMSLEASCVCLPQAKPETREKVLKVLAPLLLKHCQLVDALYHNPAVVKLLPVLMSAVLATLGAVTTTNASNASNASMANRISKEGEEVESEVVEGTFIRGYSMRPKPVNEYYIIFTPDDSDGAPPMDMPSFGGKMTATQPSVAHLTPLVVPTEEELGIRRSAFSPSSRVGSPLTSSWVVASPSNRSRAMGGESFSPQARLTKRSHNPRSPSSLSSKAASPRNRSLVSATQSP